MKKWLKLGPILIILMIIFALQQETKFSGILDELSGFTYEMERRPMVSENKGVITKTAISTNKNKEWELVWEDNFDGLSINQEKWNMEDWAADKNNELQYYSPNNVEIKNGLLQIISREERYGGRNYTSGAIHSKNKFSFLYGKVEMRAKLPSGQGIFPAFWMMTNKDYTWLPEIDILEMLGHKPDEIWMVLHWMGDDRKLKSASSSYKGLDYSKGFHLFGIEWTPEYIAWFIDGEEKFRIDQNVPQEEMFLYLNTAIGGNWPGDPDQTTPFPTLFEVDYVRVYQKLVE